MAPGVSALVPWGSSAYVARRSRRHPDPSGGSVRLRRAFPSPVPFSSGSEAAFPCWPVASPDLAPFMRTFAISSTSVRKSGQCRSCLSRLSVFPHPRSEDRARWSVGMSRGLHRHIDRFRKFPCRFRPFDPVRRGSFPVRQAKGDSAGRVVQAGERKLIHRMRKWRWTTVDKAVIRRGFAAPANDSSRCSAACQRPCLASSFRRSALSLMKPSASFWS